MQTQIFAYLINICYQHKKTVSIAAAFLIVWLFGDSLLPIIGHFLHILLEVVESMLEHFLENVFGLSSRQAQIILFYSAIAMIARLAWYAARKAYFSALHGYEVAQTFSRSPKVKKWIKAMLMFSALGTTIYIFS